MAEGISVISSASVRGAYGASKSMVAEKSDATEATSFTQMVEKAAGDAAQTVRESDIVVRSGLAGEASTQQVVEATIAMESTVKIAVSMRDKLVAAYQEVLRMPI